jgi:hypothetical protein
MPEGQNTRVTSLEESMRLVFTAQHSFQETESLFRQRDRGFPQIDASIEKSRAQTDAELFRQLDTRIAELLADIRKLRRDRQ